jgi:hypoxanthine phosphoribosyltransferase
MKEQVENGAKILVVDDINDTGATFEWIKNDWNVDSNSEKSNVKFAALIDNVPSSFVVEYNGIEINKEENPEWIVFPYEEWW